MQHPPGLDEIDCGSESRQNAFSAWNVCSAPKKQKKPEESANTITEPRFEEISRKVHDKIQPRCSGKLDDG